MNLSAAFTDPLLPDAGYNRSYAGYCPSLSTGERPNDDTGIAGHNARMAKPIDVLVERIDSRASELGLNDRRVSMLATGAPDAIREIRRGKMPRGERLAQIAAALETNVDWLMGGDGPADGPPRPRQAGGVSVAAPARNFNFGINERNVPTLGSVIGCNFADFSDGVPVEVHMVDMGEVIGHAPRPVGIQGNRDAYTLYIAGDSQSPRFEPGDLIYVNPKRPPNIGDDVVVQLVEPDGDGERVVSALIKRLRRRTAAHVELEQFNPPRLITVPADRVRAIHRVMSLSELLGFA